MKLDNLNAPGEAGHAVARGHTGRRAGTPGSTWSGDADSTQVTAPRVHLIGAGVSEGEIDGEDAVIINLGGSGGGSEGGGGGSGTSTGFSSDGMVPYYIRPGFTFTVPLYKQGLFHMTIENDGILAVDGYLIEVP